AGDPYQLANSWRVRDTAASLFTYNSGEGPFTYNRYNLGDPLPSPQELAPYRLQAAALITNVCRPNTVDETLLTNAAYELFIGRVPDELARTSLCFYQVSGVVMNSLVPGLPVPGAKITVSSAQLNATCETWTDRQGRYTCSIAPDGQTGQVIVQVSGRGTATAAVTFAELPPAGGTLEVVRNFSLAPTTLQLTGLVRDQLNQPLYNAQLRIQGPDGAGFVRSYAVSSADGAYATYLMLDDGVLAGQNTYQVSFNPDHRLDPDARVIASSQTFTFSGLNEHALNLVPQDIQLTG